MMTHRPNTIWTLLLFSLTVLAFQTEVSGAQDLAKPVQSQGKPAHHLVISPKSISADTCITITFPIKHPRNMSVRTPTGVWFVVHEKAEKIAILPYAQFPRATSIQKKVADIKGVKWVDGKRVVGAVFNEPGEYLFYMADNLETEPENTFNLTGTVVYVQ